MRKKIEPHEVRAIKSDVEQYFQIFWPQLDESWKKTLTKDIRAIIDGTFEPRKREWDWRLK
tara:strand:+ start:146 stop:328 length:183 start_codon:yes stop_codon:yes gene_type:complete